MSSLRLMTCLIVTLLTAPAMAAEYTWHLDNVSFENDMTLEGQFNWDTEFTPSSGGYTLIDLTLSDIDGVVWTYPGGDLPSADGTTLSIIDPGTFTAINLAFASPMSSPAAGVATTGDLLVNLAGPFQMREGGTVSAVPIPAAAWLFGSALIALAGIKRKKLTT